MGRIFQLYQLQSLDSEINKINQELVAIAAKLGESEALKQAKHALESISKELGQNQTNMQDLDLEVKSLTDKVTNQEKKLYSGKALSPKEAANLQEEVASLKRWQTQREENLLEAMLIVEEAEETSAQAQTKLSELEAAWRIDQKDLIDNQQSLERRRSARVEQRLLMTDKISAVDLKIYEKLRTKKAGRAVAAVKNKVCQGCGITPSNSKLQRARAGTELTYCGACGRILYVS